MGRDPTVDVERRVLLIAPTKRDGEVTSALLAKTGLTCVVCADLRQLLAEIELGAGVLMLAQEALIAPERERFVATLHAQPEWSDLPLVLLMQAGTPPSAVDKVIRSLPNVTHLDRPAPTRSVISAVQAAVRGRERQYQIRDQLESIRRAEADARELRRQLQIAIDASELGTFHCEIPLGRIVWNDQCKRHFWLPLDAEVDIELFYRLLHPDDRERTRQAVEACVYAGDNYDIEYRVVSPQGQIRWIRATGRTTFDQQNQPVQFDGTTQDITERKRAEEALRDADRRKDEFLATLAHELRNPLAPIRNSLQLMRLSEGLAPHLEPARAIMERQVDHMVRLVDDLLDVSRISSGKIALRKETVVLADAIATAVETVRPLIEGAGHRLSIDLPTEAIVLEADRVRLVQVLGNLINNAAKYTAPGGQIRISAIKIGGQARISVKDTGLGIPAPMLPRVFDMFAQVDRTLSRAQGGLGIGLTLTKKFVEMHGGQIEVQSDGPDRGSEFNIHLPLAPCPTLPPPSAQFSRRDPRRLPPHKILVVDDTIEAGYVLGQLLETMGQEVCTTDNARAALESIRHDRPDLVISDIAMPQMDGYEFARRLREDPDLVGLPLAALTGYGQTMDRQRAKAAGFDYYLVKPVSVEALYDLLATLSGHVAE